MFRPENSIYHSLSGQWLHEREVPGTLGRVGVARPLLSECGLEAMDTARTLAPVCVPQEGLGALALGSCVQTSKSLSMKWGCPVGKGSAAHTVALVHTSLEMHCPQ